MSRRVLDAELEAWEREHEFYTEVVNYLTNEDLDWYNRHMALCGQPPVPRVFVKERPWLSMEWIR